MLNPIALYRLHSDPLRFLTEAAAKGGDLIHLGNLPRPLYLLNHPALVRHVLQDNQANYRKRPAVDRIKVLLGEGLTTTDGDRWQSQREGLDPLFQRQCIKPLVSHMTTETAALLDQWAAADRRLIDILAEVLRLTRRIILKILFGSEADDAASALQGPLTELVCATEQRVWSWFSLPLTVATPANLRFRRGLRRLDEFVLAAVDRRRRHGRDGADMLGALLEKMDPGSGEPHRLQALRDEVITMIIAGHTTTAAALAWVWVLLAQHPQVQARLHAEINGVLRGALPNAVTLGTLPYTRAVLMEALRLYPPTWLTARCAVAADRWGAHSIPAGSILLICPYTMHRHPGYWSASESFDPGRFLGEQATERTSYSYLVFGGGPRRCIGQGLALLEMQLIVALTAQRFRLHLAADSVVTPHARITLRPEGARMVPEPLAAIRATSALPGHLAVARNR